MHFDCFKSLGETDKCGRKKSKQREQVPVWQQPRPSMNSTPVIASTRQSGQYDSELLGNLVQQMTGQLEAIFVEDEEVS